MINSDLSSWKLFCLKRINDEYTELDINNKKYFIPKAIDFRYKENYQLELNVNEITNLNFLDNFEKQLKKNNINKIYFRVNPFELNTDNQLNAINILKRNNYKLLQVNILNLDLKKNNIELRKNIRKSYKGLINKERRSTQVVFNYKNDNKKKLFNDWVKIYSNALSRGNTILNNELYLLLEQAIYNDECLLSVAYQSKQAIGGMLFGFNSIKADYNAAANIPRIENEKSRGVGHLLMWESILKLKEIKKENLELGSFKSPNANVDINKLKNDKIDNILNFKRGFGANRLLSNYFFKVLG